MTIHTLDKTTQNPKLLVNISILYGIIFITANIAAPRLLSLGNNINLPGGIILFGLTFIFSNIISEVYGSRTNKLIIATISIAGLLSSCYFYFINNVFNAPEFIDIEKWQYVLNQAPLVMLASIISFYYSEKTNGFILQFLKFKKHKLWVRLVLSTITAAFIDSFVFLPVIFFQQVYSRTMPAKVVLFTGILLLIAKTVIELIFVLLGITQKIIKKIKIIENMDTTDTHFNFKISNYLKVNKSIFEDNKDKKEDESKIYYFDGMHSHNKHQLITNYLKFAMRISSVLFIICIVIFDFIFFYTYW